MSNIKTNPNDAMTRQDLVLGVPRDAVGVRLLEEKLLVLQVVNEAHVVLVHHGKLLAAKRVRGKGTN